MSRDQILTSAVTGSKSPSMVEIDMQSIELFASISARPVGEKQQVKILEIVVGGL